MKRIFLALTLSFGVSLITSSALTTINSHMEAVSNIQPNEIKYLKIELSEIPETVNKQVDEEFPGEIIKEAYVAYTLDGTTYKIVLVKDGNEHEELFEVKNEKIEK